jgi:MOSC domain-containing protein YiiM
MTVELICTASTRGAALALHDAVSVVAGAGITGDRMFGRVQKCAGQNLTLVEAEEIERFNTSFGLRLPLTALRRNLVTRGVRLNELVGRDFSVGEVLLRGVELCEPCARLARFLAETQLAPQQIMRELAHRAGLRADVLSSGTIARGDRIVERGLAQGALI